MLKLIIGNKRYSSWSMRPWLVLRAFDIPFEEEVIPLDQPETRARILERSPSGRVPALYDGDRLVWDSLAIIEYLAEAYPEHAIWPRDAGARAHARCVSAEMHAGFPALRELCPMNLVKTPETGERWPKVAGDIVRIMEVWAQARGEFGAEDGFLYGDFCAADAMFVPVATRIETYGLPVDEAARDYVKAVLSSPAVQAWRSDARDEPWEINTDA